MAKKTIDFDVVREIALALPDVEETTIHGAPCFKLRGKLLTCQAFDKSVESNTLAVRIDFDQRAKLLAADPSVCYVMDQLHELPDGARAFIADRSEIFNRFDRLGMGVCRFED